MAVEAIGGFMGAVAYLEIPSCSLSTGQSLTDTVREVLGLAARDGAGSLFLELDGHDVRSGRGWGRSGRVKRAPRESQ